MKSVVIVILLIVIGLTNPLTLNAHPGRTASDGCHYCRTNCDSWGVGWDVRHCHGGYTPPPSNTDYTSSYDSSDNLGGDWCFFIILIGVLTYVFWPKHKRLNEPEDEEDT